MKKLFKTLGICSLALPACLALAGGSASAASVSGSTNLTVTVPPFITLYYPTALKLTLADAGSSRGSSATKPSHAVTNPRISE